MQHCDVSVDNSNCLPKSARGLLAQPVLISVTHWVPTRNKGLHTEVGSQISVHIRGILIYLNTC